MKPKFGKKKHLLGSLPLLLAVTLLQACCQIMPCEADSVVPATTTAPANPNDASEEDLTEAQGVVETTVVGTVEIKELQVGLQGTQNRLTTSPNENHLIVEDQENHRVILIRLDDGKILMDESFEVSDAKPVFSADSSVFALTIKDEYVFYRTEDANKVNSVKKVSRGKFSSTQTSRYFSMNGKMIDLETGEEFEFPRSGDEWIWYETLPQFFPGDDWIGHYVRSKGERLGKFLIYSHPPLRQVKSYTQMQGKEEMLEPLPGDLGRAFPPPMTAKASSKDLFWSNGFYVEKLDDQLHINWPKEGNVVIADFPKKIKGELDQYSKPYYHLASNGFLIAVYRSWSETKEVNRWINPTTGKLEKELEFNGVVRETNYQTNRFVLLENKEVKSSALVVRDFEGNLTFEKVAEFGIWSEPSLVGPRSFKVVAKNKVRANGEHENHLRAFSLETSKELWKVPHCNVLRLARTVGVCANSYLKPAKRAHVFSLIDGATVHSFEEGQLVRLTKMKATDRLVAILADGKILIFSGDGPAAGLRSTPQN